jgi:hypothetical protein
MISYSLRGLPMTRTHQGNVIDRASAEWGWPNFAVYETTGKLDDTKAVSSEQIAR